MELIIDTKLKTVLIKNEVNLNDLLKLMKKLFDKEWIEWKIKSVVQTEHHYPYPWWYQWYPEIEPYHLEYKIIGQSMTFEPSLWPENHEIICLTETSTVSA